VSITLIILTFISGCVKLQGLMIVDRSGFYGSRNHVDQHRDMRLDIDDMSYEVSDIFILTYTTYILFRCLINEINRSFLHLGKESEALALAYQIILSQNVYKNQFTVLQTKYKRKELVSSAW